MNDRGDLMAFLDEAWRHLTRGVADKHAPARHPTFATVSPEGRPEARSVVLRRADQAAAALEVHTDCATSKVRALQQAPYAALHVWVPRAKMQLRLAAEVEMFTGDAALERWEQVPEAARMSYGTQPHPGTPIKQVDDYHTSITSGRFTVLYCRLTEMDLLHLGAPHRRAKLYRDDGWSGTWVAP
jgi:hypothetical protein